MRIRPCESSPAERAHGPPRGVEQHSASCGDLTEPEASRSIAPSSLAGRAEGEATAARQLLCAAHGFLGFRRPPSGVCETLVRGKTGWLLGVAYSLHRFTHLVFQKFEQIPKCQLQKILRVFFVKRETLSENYSYVISFLRGHIIIPVLSSRDAS